MARGFKKQLQQMIEEKTKTIYINWINIPEHLVRANPDVISELRDSLRSAGYTRDTEYNAPQEQWTLSEK